MKLPKVYEPSQFEADVYALWEKSQAFLPRKTGKSYSVVVPPPNANGNLHLGHALTLGVEDISVRYHRMKGESALLLPGADHAGIERAVQRCLIHNTLLNAPSIGLVVRTAVPA